MKTANLTGALLDYWTARAEGVPADQLEIRPVQRPDPRTPDTICIHWRAEARAIALPYSTLWSMAGPLIEKHSIDLFNGTDGPGELEWRACVDLDTYETGPTPLIAICRAVVRAAFGDEVEDSPC